MLGLVLTVAAALPGPTTLGARDHIVLTTKTSQAYPGGWTPTADEALRVKAGLKTWLASPAKGDAAYDPSVGKPNDWYLRDAEIVQSTLDGYVLQYVGIRYVRGQHGYNYAADGKRAILVHGILNGSLMVKDIDLDQERMIFDGGRNFFDALVETDGTVVWFAVHGFA